MWRRGATSSRMWDDEIIINFTIFVVLDEEFVCHRFHTHTHTHTKTQALCVDQLAN